MSRAPFPRSMISSDRPTSTSGSGDVQQCFVIDNRHSGEFLIEGAYYNDLLKEVVQLARRLVFSEAGIEFAARRLMERDCTASGARLEVDEDERLKKAVSEVRGLERVDLMSIVVDIKMKAMSQISNHTVPLIYLGRDILEAAARSEYRSKAPDADAESAAQRDRHVFFMAVVIANHLQLAIRWIIERMRLGARDVLAPKKQVQNSVPAPPSPKVTSFVQRLRAVQYVKPVPGQRQLSDSEQRIKRGQDGWSWETTLFGGVLVRLEDRTDDQETRSYSPGYTGLAVMKKEDGVEGHMVLRDDIIHSIVRGVQGWERYLPFAVQEHSVAGFVAEDHPEGAYRSLDGTPYGRYSASGKTRYVADSPVVVTEDQTVKLASSLKCAMTIS